MIYNMFTQKNMFSRLEASDSLRVAFAPVAQLNGLINKAHMENAVKWRKFDIFPGNKGTIRVIRVI